MDDGNVAEEQPYLQKGHVILKLGKSPEKVIACTFPPPPPDYMLSVKRLAEIGWELWGSSLVKLLT